jgi:hypothetical protein
MKFFEAKHVALAKSLLVVIFILVGSNIRKTLKMRSLIIDF